MNSSPCAKLTTSMMPKINVRPDATKAKIMPVTMPLIVWISSWSSGISMLLFLSAAPPSFSRKREPRAACCGGCPWAPPRAAGPCGPSRGSAGATVSRIAASHAHILMDDPIIGAQLGGRGVVADHPFFQDVDAPGGVQGQRNILFDEQHRDMLALEHADDLPDLRNHAGHQSFGGLVQ